MLKITSDTHDDSMLPRKQHHDDKQQQRNQIHQEGEESQYRLNGDRINQKRIKSISCPSNDFSTTVKIQRIEEKEPSLIDADPGSTANPHDLMRKTRIPILSQSNHPKELSQHQLLSRGEIEALAVSQGAKVGG